MRKVHRDVSGYAMTTGKTKRTFQPRHRGSPIGVIESASRWKKYPRKKQEIM